MFGLWWNGKIQIMDVQLICSLQQLCDIIQLIWTKISEEHVESMLWRVNAVLKAQMGPTWHQQGVINESVVALH